MKGLPPQRGQRGDSEKKIKNKRLFHLEEKGLDYIGGKRSQHLYMLCEQ